jgi:hypothetical protein
MKTKVIWEPGDIRGGVQVCNFNEDRKTFCIIAYLEPIPHITSKRRYLLVRLFTGESLQKSAGESEEELAQYLTENQYKIASRAY